MPIEWAKLRMLAHQACPCVCQARSHRPCISKDGVLDPCWLCADLHKEIDEVVELSQKEVVE